MPSPLFGPTQAAATYTALGNSDTPIMGMTEQQLLQQILVAVANLSTGGGGGGTVTSFSAVGQDGVGVNVTNPTTTPELTISLGNITPDRVTVATAGAVSTSEIGVTGTWFSGGSATTTKPKVSIEPAGATSNNWSTGGTGLGINAANGFAGSLLRLQTNAVTKFDVDYAGAMIAGTGALGVGWTFRGAADVSFMQVGGGGIQVNNDWRTTGSLYVDNASGTLTLFDVSLSRASSSVMAVQSGVTMRLGVTAEAGTSVASTHTLLFQDITGTVYKVLASNV